MAKYGHMPIYGHNTSGPNSLTIHDKTINFDYLPMFLWCRNVMKIFKMLFDQQFGL